jgi:hypothetical protein
LKILFSVFMHVPLSALYRYLNGATVRHLYGLVLGIMTSIFLYQADFLYVIGVSLVIYLIIFIQKEKCIRIVQFGGFLALSLLQIARMIKSTPSFISHLNQLIQTTIINHLLAINYHHSMIIEWHVCL